MMTNPFGLSRVSAGSLVPRPPPSSGEVVFEHVIETIREFEKALTPEEEVGFFAVDVLGARQMHIVNVQRKGREMIAFHGVSEQGKPMLVLQHITQVSILLTALPKLREQARRIGFLSRSEDASTERAP
jgi:hypothetical protein